MVACFRPATRLGLERPMNGAAAPGRGDRRRALARRRPGAGRSGRLKESDDGQSTKDNAGRPIVVVTGMGVVTSLGAGKTDNWRSSPPANPASARSPAFATDGLKTRIAGTVDFVPVEPLLAPALSRAPRRPGGRGSHRAIRHRQPRRFSRAAVPRGAADRDRMAAAPRSRAPPPAPTTRSTYDDLLRAAQRPVSRLSRALPVRLGRRPSGRQIRHQGLADFAVDRLRLGRDRDPARRRGDPPRRDRCRALHRHRRLGQSGSR